MLVELDLQYDKEKLLEEAATIDYKPFESGFNDGNWFDYAPTWKQAKVPNHKNFSEVIRLNNFIKNKIDSIDIRPRFYKQQSNTEVPKHVDINTKCSINIILSDAYGPVVFRKQDPKFYQCAILNTTIEHSVPAYNKERILLKFSIFDKSFDEVVNSFT